MRNTPNYNLPQYEGTDKFTKEVLNDAFSKVDTAINDLQETFNINGSTSTLTTQEVVNARNGKQNLKERIDEIDESIRSKAIFNTNNEIYATRVARLVNDGSQNKLSNPQGFCFDGKNYYCAYRQYNGTGDDTLTRIVKYDINFNEISSVTSNYGHGNSICVSGNYLYISDTTTKIYKLNLSDLSYSNTINVSFGFSAICCYNDMFYLLSSNKISKTNNFTDYEVINYTLPKNNGISQGFDFDGEYFYMLRTSPNVILQYDINGNLKYINRLPLYADNVFKIGEVEDISLLNGDIYINAVTVDTYNLTEMNSIFMLNLKTNLCGTTIQNFMELNSTSEGNVIFVDNTNTNKNPLGTFSNPFPTLYEALCLISSDYINNCVIYIKDTVTSLDENIWFRGTLNNVVINALNNSCSIKSIRLSRCNATLVNLQATDVTFEYGNFNCDIGFNSLKCTSSNVRLFGGKLNTTSPITLYSSTLEGVENLNVNIMDFGCHGVYKINKTIQIGETFTNELVSKAKAIYLSILDTNKIYTCIITKNGLNELNINNIYTGSAGVTFSTYHVTKSSNTLVFNDVRTITLDKVATTITTQNSNCIINGLTFIL